MTRAKGGGETLLHGRLQRALDAHEPIRLMRSIAGADVLEGYVLATGP